MYFINSFNLYFFEQGETRENKLIKIKYKLGLLFLK